MKITKKDKQKLQKLAQNLNNQPLTGIIEANKLTFSLETVFREFQKADVVTGKKQLLFFQCQKCNKSFRVIAIFWGLTYKPDCPHCGFNLHFNKRLYFPFYYPASTDYILYRGKLVSISEQNVFELVVPHINQIKDLNLVLLTHPKPRTTSKIHIIQKYIGMLPVTFCNIYYWPDKPHRLGKPTEATQVEKICRFCLMKMIKQYNKNENLMPQIMQMPQTILSRQIKLLLDAKIHKSIRRACQLNGVHQSTYYEARNKHPDIYLLIQQYSYDTLFKAISFKTDVG